MVIGPGVSARDCSSVFGFAEVDACTMRACLALLAALSPRVVPSR